MKSPEEIISLFATKNVDDDWSFAEYGPSDTAKWTHGYHRYPAKFIPQIAEKLLDEYLHNENAHINDPFMGCGTTIVTAISRGYKASGTDINGIAHLITKVKSMPVEPDYLHEKLEYFRFRLKCLTDNSQSLFHDEIKPLIPERHMDRINYWFPEENKNKLGKILGEIYDEQDEPIRDFLLIAFSHILKGSSIWHPKSTKPTRSLKKIPSDPYKLMQRHLMKMEKGNRVFYGILPRDVKENIAEYLNIKMGDARRQPVPDGTVDMIITSSPYVTSYEYADIHQLSTIWLDMVDNLTEHRKEYIGTSYKKYENKKLRSSIATGIINTMSNRNKKIAKEIEAFFMDMEEVFDESYRILKAGGRCCFIIGNTKLRDISILNAEVFAESMQLSGFKLDRIIKREIPLKVLPQRRDKNTGKFIVGGGNTFEAYPVEYIVIGLKE